MAGAWFVWSGGRTCGMFPTEQAALKHVRICANDHRARVELTTLGVSAYRYVGPRGRRHGTRLVAFIGTEAGLSLLGIDVGVIRDALGASA